MKEKVIKNNTSQKNASEKLIKTLLVFICYLLYSNVISIVFSTFNIVNTTLISFVADLIFLICIVFAYRENLKNDLKDLKENYKVIDVIKIVVLWFAIIFIFNICMGVLTDLLWPTASNMQDGNTKLLFDSNTLNLTYKIFKTMVFAIVAEELIFRESISDVIKNKWVFILVSASVYTLINFAFVGFSSKTIVLDILSYFLPALLFSYAYTKYNNNIILLMLIKFTYQLVPLTLLLIKS